MDNKKDNSFILGVDIEPEWFLNELHKDGQIIKFSYSDSTKEDICLLWGYADKVNEAHFYDKLKYEHGLIKKIEEQEIRNF